MGKVLEIGFEVGIDFFGKFFCEGFFDVVIGLAKEAFATGKYFSVDSYSREECSHFDSDESTADDEDALGCGIIEWKEIVASPDREI